MRKFVRSRLTVMICCALCAPSAWVQEQEPAPAAQEPIAPGLYTTVDEKAIYLIVGDEVYDLETGESAHVSDDGFEFIDTPPAFLNWPCGTTYAMGRGTLQTYAIEDLPPTGRLGEIVRLYLEESKVPEGSPLFLNGEYHLRLPWSEIDEMRTDLYWYRGGPVDAPLSAQRPDILLIAVFRGTGQVVVDTNYLDELKAKYPDGDVPVLFLFPEENEVPISYFGRSPSIDEVVDAYTERGVKVAEVPIWFAGDRHLDYAPGALADIVGAPELDPEELEQLRGELQEDRLTLKPISVIMPAGGNQPMADDPLRIRAAEELNLSTVPVVLTFYTEASHASHCGLPPPMAAVGALGSSNQSATDTPGPGEVRGPDRPPEIELPNPPQPEKPASGN